MTLPVALLAAAACNDPARPLDNEGPIAPATVVVPVDTVRGYFETSSEVTYLQLKFPMTITNASNDTIRYTKCSTTLQYERQNRWEYAGGGGCFLSNHVDPIGPGATREFEVWITIPYSGKFSEFRGSLPGRYRYNVSFLENSGDWRDLGKKPSNPFTIVVAN